MIEDLRISGETKLKNKLNKNLMMNSMPDAKFFPGWGYGIPQYKENGEWWYWVPGTGTLPESKLKQSNNEDYE